MRILTSIHLSDIQKETLAKIKAAPNPHVAWNDVTDASEDIDQNFAAALEMLEKLDLISVRDGELEVTDKGLEVMNDENLTDEMGELTDEGQQLASMQRGGRPDVQQQQPAAPAQEPAGDEFPMESLSLLKAINEDANANEHMKLVERQKVTPEKFSQLTKEAIRFFNGDADFYDLSGEAQDALYSAFMDSMPYGVQTGDDGTPEEWLSELDPERGVEGVKRYLYRQMS